MHEPNADTHRSMTRRDAIARATTAVTLAVTTGLPSLAAACGSGSTGSTEPAANGRLQARPGQPNGTVQPGLIPLGLVAGRDGFLYVPTAYRSDTPAPLALLLHGAGGSAQRMIETHRGAADVSGLLLLAPFSRAATWDAIYEGYGTDILFIDGALAWAFARCAVDPARVSVMGFSDGATYALGVGRINGDLFGRVAALSPGYLLPARAVGKPKVFITHGTQDQVLPIDVASRRIVPSLRGAGYDVEYHEFLGGHTITAELLTAATNWVSTK